MSNSLQSKIYLFSLIREVVIRFVLYTITFGWDKRVITNQTKILKIKQRLRCKYQIEMGIILKFGS